MLSQHADVRNNVVVLREDVPGDKRLAAYVVLRHQASMDPAKLRSFLKEQLPDYMIPADYVWLDELPLTPNGKVNRLALPAPSREGQSQEEEFVAPRNEVERTLAEIWSLVLGVERVGIRDNFFDLGGTPCWP